MQFILDGDDFLVEHHDTLIDPYFTLTAEGQHRAHWHFAKDFFAKYRLEMPAEIKAGLKQRVAGLVKSKQIFGEQQVPNKKEFDSYLADGEELYNFQAQAVQYGAREYERILLADDVGLGKAQPLTAKVLTPNGWKKIGKLKKGDHVTDPVSGGAVKIAGIYDRGIMDVYEVEMTDGARTRCSIDHLWAVRTSNWKQRGKGYTVKPLSELIATYQHCTDERLQYLVPMTAPVMFSEKAVELDPYLVGCLLGDGGLKHGTVVMSTADEEIMRTITGMLPEKVTPKKVGKYDYRLSAERNNKKNPLAMALKRMGLMGRGAADKHIPNDYLFNSIKNRGEMFRGLMDTDGYISKDNVLQFTSISPELANGVKFLAESFGGTARVNSKIPSYTYKGERKKGQRAYTLTIGLPAWVKPFKLKRKATAYKPRKKYLPSRKIKRIEFVGKEPVRCISLESWSGLYLTDDSIVTHNTIINICIALDRIERGQVKTAHIIVPASLQLQWLSEIRKFVNPEVFPDLWTVCTNRTKKERTAIYRRTKKIHDGTDLGQALVISSYSIVLRDKMALNNVPFDMVALDEGTKIKNGRAKTTKAIKQLYRKVRYKVVSTATPVENGLDDLYNIVAFIDNRIFKNRQYFAERYCEFEDKIVWMTIGGRRTQTVVRNLVGYKNLPDARQKLIQIYVRRTIDDVEIELPAVVSQTIELEMSAKQRKIYKEMKGETKEDYTDVTRDNLLGQMTGLREICDSPELIDQAIKECPKANEIKRQIEDDLKYTKVIIITAFKRFAKIIERELKKHRPLLITGDVSHEERQDIQNYFEHGTDRRILIGTTAIERGLNLQVASVLINVEPPFNPAKLLQRLGRLRRIGSKHPTLRMINLVMKNTIEQKIVDILYDKGKLFEQLFSRDDDVKIGNLLSMDTMDFGDLADLMKDSK